MATRRPEACAWCEAPLPPSAARAPGGLCCARCGAVTTDPWPADAELDAAYAGHYRPPAGRFAGPGDAVLRRLRALPAARIDRAAPPGPVLDVGAGEGGLVAALARRGREAIGLERDGAPGAVPRIVAGDVLDHTGRYAAVVFWHSLEHLRRPGAALRHAARDLLVPGGLLVIAVPNPASLQARAFGDRWLALDPPRHLVHVPQATLLGTLRAEGLTVERRSGVRGGQVLFGWLHGLVGTLPGRPDLYAAIRRPEARERPAARPGATVAAAAALSPLALAAAAAEIALGRAGTTYVEARA
jgi:SAM-dependent methyltransferase